MHVSIHWFMYWFIDWLIHWLTYVLLLSLLLVVCFITFIISRRLQPRAGRAPGRHAAAGAVPGPGPGRASFLFVVCLALCVGLYVSCVIWLCCLFGYLACCFMLLDVFRRPGHASALDSARAIGWHYLSNATNSRIRKLRIWLSRGFDSSRLKQILDFEGWNS